MPLGTLIELGPAAVVELTGLRTPCVLIDRFRAGLKRQVLSSAETGPAFKSGVLGVVRAGGPVVAGDSARVRLPSSSVTDIKSNLPDRTTPLGAELFKQVADPDLRRSSSSFADQAELAEAGSVQKFAATRS
ncbi:hypothetical protein [Bradyrhizobium japonicum]|uniref:hypothetical protein n=1 Tax=Bradyrhizobium japonicum TaxID=375 RepID=UPI003211C927